MDIKVIDKKDYKVPSPTSCEVNCIHVKISDFKKIVQDFGSHISNTSWINNLDAYERLTFNANMQKTIDKIVNEIIAKVGSNVNTDIGEYIVSFAAQHALHTEFTHKKIPLAELLKEKISGNPGFDFHTVSQSKYLVFGEAMERLARAARPVPAPGRHRRTACAVAPTVPRASRSGAARERSF